MKELEIAEMIFGGHFSKNISLINADCFTALKTFPDSFIDSLVTDPPAGISFMGKDWDGDKGGRNGWISWLTEVMRECHRVMKPGAHGLVWAIPRTSHWTMTALENAGFEIRDIVTHLFGTGFPKSLDVSKAIDKEAGVKRSIIGRSENGAGNSGKLLGEEAGGGGCTWEKGFDLTAPATDDAKKWQGFGTALKPACEFWVLIRKPCSEKTVAKNVLKWGTGALNIDGCRIEGGILDSDKRSTHSGPSSNINFGGGKATGGDGARHNLSGRFPANLALDEESAEVLDEQSGSGGASRFFYVAKASKSDRGEDNKHPTVKSTGLMRYLCRLITPPKGVVLDPFMGSGSTGVAAKKAGMRFIGVDAEPEYFGYAQQRLVL